MPVVSGGNLHSVFIDTNQVVWCCGSNHLGQLGLGDTSENIGRDGLEVNPIQPLTCLPPITSVATGSYHTLFLDEIGRVWSTGQNTHGQLGSGNNEQRFVPESIPDLPPIKKIFAGSYHSQFIDTEGKVWGCGYNLYGQLGFGDKDSRNVPEMLDSISTHVVSICGYSHSVFLTTIGEVYVCGSNSNNQLGLPLKNNNPETSVLVPTKIQLFMQFKKFVAISAGINHTLFLTEDGNVHGCGANSYGELGGTSSSQLQEIKVCSNPISSISAGQYHSLFLDSAGNTYSCGFGFHYQLGSGKWYDIAVPRKISKIPKCQAIFCGFNYSIFIDKKGNMWGCGLTKHGELGDAQSAEKPRQIGNNLFNILLDANIEISNTIATKSARNV